MSKLELPNLPAPDRGDSSEFDADHFGGRVAGVVRLDAMGGGRVTIEPMPAVRALSPPPPPANCARPTAVALVLAHTREMVWGGDGAPKR